MAGITISREKIRKSKGVVILPVEEYYRLLSVPTYQLKGRAARRLDKLVEDGLREYRLGKTEPLDSFLKREYPKLHGKYAHRGRK